MLKEKLKHLVVIILVGVCIFFVALSIFTYAKAFRAIINPGPIIMTATSSPVFQEVEGDRVEKEEPVSYNVVDEFMAEATAYNVGDITQCSGDPCRSANGENICLAVSLGYKRCANNCYKFGTRAVVSGYGECLVTDRLNSKYDCNVWDVAFLPDQIEEAREFGRRPRLIKILE